MGSTTKYDASIYCFDLPSAVLHKYRANENRTPFSNCDLEIEGSEEHPLIDMEIVGHIDKLRV